MENTRANWIIDHSKMDQSEKEFLNKHLEMYEMVMQSMTNKLSELQDVIDYGRFIDNEVMASKETIIKMLKDSPKEEQLIIILNKIYHHLFN